jgi:micrococcal nuclease
MYKKFPCELVRVKDGDTYVILVDLNTPFKIKTEITVRVNKVNCPEKNTLAGKNATEFAKDYLREKELTINVSGLDKYGRYVCDLTVNNEDFASILIKNGHATQLTSYNTKIKSKETLCD